MKAGEDSAGVEEVEGHQREDEGANRSMLFKQWIVSFLKDVVL